MRGHGSHPAQLTMRRPIQSSSSFIVHIKYVKLPTETFQVNASTYDAAIEQAMAQRASIEIPREVEARQI